MSTPYDKSYFQQLYSEYHDPWDYETNEYDKQKYQYTLDVIQNLHPKKVLEIGCSIGVFTQQLAGIVEHLYAIDFSSIVIEKAKQRCHELNNVTFLEVDLYDLKLPQQVDLVVASEVFYYLDPSEESWSKIVTVLNNVLAHQGHMVCVICGHHMCDWDSYISKFSNNRIKVERVEYNFSEGLPYTLSVFKAARNILLI